MTSPQPWDWRDIFSYGDEYQKCCGADIQFYDCYFKVDFWGIPKGYYASMIEIGRDLRMVVYNGEEEVMHFAPKWTPLNVEWELDETVDVSMNK